MRFVWLLAALWWCSCDVPDPCEGVPCSEGRVCVVAERKVSCVAVDAGVP